MTSAITMIAREHFVLIRSRGHFRLFSTDERSDGLFVEVNGGFFNIYNINETLCVRYQIHGEEFARCKKATGE